MLDPVTISGELCVERVAEFRTQLLESISVDHELAIDISGVTRIDLSGIQLIYATRRECERRGIALRLIGNITDAVGSVISAAGFTRAPMKTGESLEHALFDFVGADAGAVE